MAARAHRQNDETLRNDRKLIGRSKPPEDVAVVSADGSRVRDARGRTYIDLTMGWCVGNLGWNPKPVMDRVRRFKGPSYVHPSFAYPRWNDLARLLGDAAPGKLARAYRCTTGTEAVELALMLAMTATGRHKIVSLEGAYHGNSFGARSIGELDVDNGLRGCAKLAPPLDAKALGRLERMLAGREVAAFIMEPISMNLGVLVPDGDFMRELVPLCQRHGTLVIADEVACGLGRTGKLFASEHFDLQPDLMCTAKALTSGVAPLAAVLATAEVARDASELSFYATFGWIPIAVEAAIATLEHWNKHGDEILDNVAERSNQIRTRLSVRLPEDAELNIAGLAVGIDLGDEDMVERISKRCRRRGLLISPEEEIIELFPALTIDRDTLGEALDILDDAISAG